MTPPVPPMARGAPGVAANDRGLDPVPGSRDRVVLGEQPERRPSPASGETVAHGCLGAGGRTRSRPRDASRLSGWRKRWRTRQARSPRQAVRGTGDPAGRGPPPDTWRVGRGGWDTAGANPRSEFSHARLIGWRWRSVGSAARPSRAPGCSVRAARWRTNPRARSHSERLVAVAIRAQLEKAKRARDGTSLGLVPGRRRAPKGLRQALPLPRPSWPRLP